MLGINTAGVLLVCHIKKQYRRATQEKQKAYINHTNTPMIYNPDDRRHHSYMTR